MSSQRPHWWMYAVAASFIALLALILYLLIWGPADLDGVNAAFEDGVLTVRSIEPGTPLALAGVLSGDRVATVAGRPVRNANEWHAVLANLEVGRPQVWRILRGGQQLEFQWTPQRGTLQNRLANGYVLYVWLLLSCFAVGLFIGFRRPTDPAARIGSWFILTASIVFGLPNGWAVPWRQLPEVIQLFLWIPTLSRFVIEGIFVSLFAVFPRPLFRARWHWLVVWVPVLATLPWRISAFHSVIYPSADSLKMPAWLYQAANIRTMVYLAAGVVVLVVSYRRLASQNEKRRVRVLVAGTAISLAAAIPVVWNFTFSGYGLSPQYWLMVVVFVSATLACPLAFAYAILRHRIFDIQVIIRQGLQYALARGAVLGLVPVLGGVLILDLAVNSRQPLADILAVRGWVYAGLGALALAAYWRRRQWLESLDRRFFREHYDAQRLLRDVVGEVREGEDFERVASHVVTRIEAALHPEFVAVMVREPGEPQYQALASAPSSHAPPPMAADSKLVALARVIGKPLEVLLPDSAWIERRLPQAEIEFARQAGIDLLVPVASGAGRPEAVLALGIRRSEEPYTREDQELLETIASSLALLIGRQASSEEPPYAPPAECPECGTCYDSGLAMCSVDGTGLVPLQLPRTLAGRYRLERRKGRGGMGTVYEATDTQLERRVAVKVIRDDWVGSAEAAQRFQREARAAAGFAHPNVVTVHDYGVEAGRRAFLVMELLEGATLRDELKRCRRLDTGRIIEIFRGVCAAVEAAHRRQLIHRDLKPENIFVARSPGAEEGGETVKVLDFGIAKYLPPPEQGETAQTTYYETAPGALVGTAAYMSPEQLLGESPAVHWDLWALAVVAYECVTGALPFPTTFADDWRHAVLSGRFTPLPDNLANAPAQWQAFFDACFAADRVRRPPSVSDFLRRLERALA